LWESWDRDGDKTFISVHEFTSLWNSMNLDSNAVVTVVEVEAYFNRNKYLLCRPFAEAVEEKYKSEKKALDGKFREFYDVVEDPEYREFDGGL
jgi:hypothetical protein